MNEIWKPAFGFEEYFLISNQGNIFSKRTNKILKQNIQGTGYSCIVTRLNGRQSKAICIRIHRIVALSFIDNPNDLPEVNHKDGNKLNNSTLNLEWVSSSENKFHAYETGLKIPIKGEKHNSSILTEEDVSRIKELYIPKIFGKRKISKLLGLSIHAVDGVLRGKSWK
jgi:hypothetical protein